MPLALTGSLTAVQFRYPAKYTVQIPGIKKLTFDWSKIVDKDGVQLVTVGTHYMAAGDFIFNSKYHANFVLNKVDSVTKWY